MLLNNRRRIRPFFGHTSVCPQRNVFLSITCFLFVFCVSFFFVVYNWCEVKAKMWILNMGKPVNIPVLNEAMAIELGANLLGEGIIFVIAAGILISEYNR